MQRLIPIHLQPFINDMYFNIEKRGLKKENFEVIDVKSDLVGEQNNSIVIDDTKINYNSFIRISWKNKKTVNHQKDYTPCANHNDKTSLSEFESDLNSGCFD